MVKGIGSVQKRQKTTANRNMLNREIAIIKLGTVSVLQETGQIAVQSEAGFREYMGWSSKSRFNGTFDEALQ